MDAVRTLGQVHETVMQAMRNRAPAMYRELLANGELRAVGAGAGEAVRPDLFGTEQRRAEESAATSVRGGVRAFEEADRGAVEQALAVALEFPAADSLTDDK